MKTNIKIISLVLMLSFCACMTPQKASPQVVVVSYQVFYDDLSPYGTWVNNPYYGYVWYPNAEAGFTPYYSNGYWVYTDCGWTWVSDYPWGWAPFHYGRWFYDDIYGPMWIPDNEWGPGWVSWRSSNDYYGWAPMGPGSNHGYYGGDHETPNIRWTFVNGGDFGGKNIKDHYVSTSNNDTIIKHSKELSNNITDKTSKVTYNAGPVKTEVEKHIGSTITPVAVKENDKPGQTLTKDQLQVYKPQVQKNNTTVTKPVPAKVAAQTDVKTVSQRTTDTQTQKTTITPVQKTTVTPVQKTKDVPVQKATETSTHKVTVTPATKTTETPGQIGSTETKHKRVKKQPKQPKQIK